MRIQQDARIFATLLAEGQSVAHAFGGGHKGWLQVVKGTAAVNGHNLKAGDGVAIENEEKIAISTGNEAELLLFELAA